MKLGVFCVLAVGICGLTAMLIQGCKNNQNADNASSPAIDTNTPPMMVDTNTPAVGTNVPVVAPVVPTNPPVYVAPVVPVVPEAAGTVYVIVKGDTFGKIAKKNHLSLKALEDANPNVTPNKMKVGLKITIPAGASTAPAASASTTTDINAAPAGGGQTYTIKSGDNLTKIAKAHGVSLKALEAANPNVDPAHIKVGKTLQIPASAVAATPAGAPVAAPVAPAMPVTAPATTPAPAGTAGGQ